MKCLDLTLPTPAENLACDEALLDWCEETGGEEVLRFWEPVGYFVVVGYANKVATEVNLATCAADGVPIWRRCSGGGTVLQGPGCLNYSVILRVEEGGPLRTITGANRFILGRNRDALTAVLGAQVTVQGHTDLTLGDLKFSGNSQRRRRRFLLFHGTFLLGLNLALVERYLSMPSKEPGYRQNRPHSGFLTNLALSADAVKAALRSAWDAKEPQPVIPSEQIAALVREKYTSREWNFRS